MLLLSKGAFPWSVLELPCFNAAWSFIDISYLSNMLMSLITKNFVNIISYLSIMLMSSITKNLIDISYLSNMWILLITENLYPRYCPCLLRRRRSYNLTLHICQITDLPSPVSYISNVQDLISLMCRQLRVPLLHLQLRRRAPIPTTTFLLPPLLGQHHNVK